MNEKYAGVVKKIERMSKADIRNALIRAGVITAEGKLTKPYR